MSRSIIMAFRIFAILVTTMSTGIYVAIAPSNETDAINYSLCTAAFLSTYLFMAVLLCIFTRIRKYDIGILTSALVALGLLVQLALAHVRLVPLPQYAEAFAAALGVAASLLPMWISKLRGESRNERHISAFMESRRAIVAPPFISKAHLESFE